MPPEGALTVLNKSQFPFLYKKQAKEWNKRDPTSKSIDEKNAPLHENNSVGLALQTNLQNQVINDQQWQVQGVQTSNKGKIKQEEVQRVQRPKIQMQATQSNSQTPANQNYSRLLENELARVRAELEVSRINEKHLKDQLNIKSKATTQLQAENEDLKNELNELKKQIQNQQGYQYVPQNKQQSKFSKLDKKVDQILQRSSESSEHLSESEDHSKFFAKLDYFQRETVINQYRKN